MVVFGAEGCWFESHSSRHVHVGTLGKSFTRSRPYDVMWRPAVKFNLLSSVHTLFVNILWCDRLYIKQNIIFIIMVTRMVEAFKVQNVRVQASDPETVKGH